MKHLFLPAFALFTQALSAQQLNSYGHLVTDEKPLSYKVRQWEGQQKVVFENLELKGSSLFRIQGGYLTLSGEYENSTSTLRVYSEKGREEFAKSFPQTINFSLSPSGTYCAFYDGEEITRVDLRNGKTKKFEGSTVFTLSENGRVARYDEKNSCIRLDEAWAYVTEPVYKVLFFRNEALFLARTKIFRIRDGEAEEVYSVEEGRLFDALTKDEHFYFSVKREVPGAFLFRTFVTVDFITVQPLEEKELKLSEKRTDYHERIPGGRLLTNEPILDPIFYYQDTVYQPVGNSYCEMQEYTPGSPYPHPGVDLLGYYTQDVRAVKKGYVKAVLTTNADFHWRIVLSSNNTSSVSQGYLYAHLEEASIPYIVGDSVNEADVIGFLVDFPVTGFVHCHFARVADSGVTWNGDWWTFDNPLVDMVNFYDSIPPEFEKTTGNDAFAFRDGSGNYLSPDSLYGSIKIISKVFDRMNDVWHDDVHRLRYNLSPLGAPSTVLLDSLAFEYNFYNDYYFTGPTYNTLLSTIYSRDGLCYSTADYTIRDFYHIVTNSDGNDTIDGNDDLQFFNTLNFVNGDYIFQVYASDAVGNTSMDSMIIRIRNVMTGVYEQTAEGFTFFPNPSPNGTFRFDAGGKDYNFGEVFSPDGRKVLSFSPSSGMLDLSHLNDGIYFARITGFSENRVIKIEKR